MAPKAQVRIFARGRIPRFIYVVGPGETVDKRRSGRWEATFPGGWPGRKLSPGVDKGVNVFARFAWRSYCSQVLRPGSDARGELLDLGVGGALLCHQAPDLGGGVHDGGVVPAPETLPDAGQGEVGPL